MYGTSFIIGYLEGIGSRSECRKGRIVSIIDGYRRDDLKGKGRVSIHYGHGYIGSNGRALHRCRSKCEVCGLVERIECYGIGDKGTSVGDVSYGDGIGTIGKVTKGRGCLEVHPIDAVFKGTCPSCCGSSLYGNGSVADTGIRRIYNGRGCDRVGRIECNGKGLLTEFVISYGIVIGLRGEACVYGLCGKGPSVKADQVRWCSYGSIDGDGYFSIGSCITAYRRGNGCGGQWQVSWIYGNGIGQYVTPSCISYPKGIVSCIRGGKCGSCNGCKGPCIEGHFEGISGVSVIDCEVDHGIGCGRTV